MAKLSTKAAVNHVENIEDGLKTLLLPVLEAFAQTPSPSRQTKDGQPVTGHEPRRPGNLGWVWFVFCNTIHNQLYGELTMPDGNIIRNAKQNLDESEMQFQRLVRSKGDDDEAIVTDPSYHRISSWLRANEAGFVHLKQLLDIGCAMHELVTGKQFVAKPMGRKGAVGSALTEAAKKAKVAELAELKAKRAAVAA